MKVSYRRNDDDDDDEMMKVRLVTLNLQGRFKVKRIKTHPGCQGAASFYFNLLSHNPTQPALREV